MTEPSCVDAPDIRINAQRQLERSAHPYMLEGYEMYDFTTKIHNKNMWTFLEIRWDGKVYLFIEMPLELHDEEWTNEDIKAEIMKRECRSAKVRKLEPRRLVDFSRFDKGLRICILRFDR